MKPLSHPDLDPYRFKHPLVPREPDELRAWGGCFEIPFKAKNGPLTKVVWLRVIATRGGAPTDITDGRLAEANRWDHVSVSTKARCPTWEEMEFIKRLFFERGECAMQLHVPPRDHVNNHEFCLHIWRPVDQPLPRPPAEMVGLSGVTGMAKAFQR